MRRAAWRAVQAALGVAVLYWAGRTVARHWSELRDPTLRLEVSPGLVVASALLVWAIYALLIGAWRGVLAGWGQRLDLRSAARIWTVSSLGKYVPGRVWAIASMAVMAQRAGVAPWAATGSAIVNQALAVGTGTVVAGLTVGSALGARYPWIGSALVALGIASAIGVGLILHPAVLRRLLRLVPGAVAPDVPPVRAVLGAAASNLAAWLGYGVSFWVLAHGVLPSAGGLSLRLAVGAFTASYLAGLLFLLAPGGVGVREGLMIVLLQGPLGLAGAGALAIASRLLLTATELGAAAFSLLVGGERARVAT